MTDRDILDALENSGAIRRGHFRLTSGRHSDTYVQCARVLENPTLTMQLAREMVARLPQDLNVDLVAAPAVGGIIIGFAVAAALDVPFIFSERQNGQMTFRRAFHIPPNAHVLVVEDVVTTGGSVAEVTALIKQADATVAAVTSLIDRGGEKAFTDPFYPLLPLDIASWEESECKQCAEGLPIDSPGSRRL